MANSDKDLQMEGNTSGGTEKKRKNNSIVWLCFKKLKIGNDTSAVCNFCPDDKKTHFVLNKSREYYENFVFIYTLSCKSLSSPVV